MKTLADCQALAQRITAAGGPRPADREKFARAQRIIHSATLGGLGAVPLLVLAWELLVSVAAGVGVVAILKTGQRVGRIAESTTEELVWWAKWLAVGAGAIWLWRYAERT